MDVINFNTVDEFYNVNSFIFDLQLEHYYLVDLATSLSENSDIEVYDAFTIPCVDGYIIALNIAGNFLVYGKNWTPGAVELLSNRMNMKRFSDWHFIGTKDLIADLFKLHPTVKYTLFKDRTIYQISDKPQVGPSCTGSAGKTTVLQLGEVAELSHQYINYEWGEREGKDLAYVKKTILHAIGDEASFFWKDNGNICAVAQIIDLDGDIPIIGSLFTAPAHRNKGYARALISELIFRLMDAEYETCGIISDSTNPTTNKMFLAVGFEPVAHTLDLIV